MIMIVLGDGDEKAVPGAVPGSVPQSVPQSVPAGADPVHQPRALPQSLSHLSTELQERLVQASFNQCLKELKSNITSNPNCVEDITLKICALNCSPAFKCRHLKLWSLFHHNCKVRVDCKRNQQSHQCLSVMAGNCCLLFKRLFPLRLFSLNKQSCYSTPMNLVYQDP